MAPRQMKPGWVDEDEDDHGHDGDDDVDKYIPH